MLNCKYSFKTHIDKPIHNGSVIKYLPERNSGRIRTKDEEFQLVNITEPLQIGDMVTYYKMPSVKMLNVYYARFISKIYHSKDGYFITDQVESHVHGDLKNRIQMVTNRISCTGREYIGKYAHIDPHCTF